MRLCYGIICLSYVVVQVISFAPSPLPGIIYDNPFCKKLIPLIEIKRRATKPIKRHQRQKRNIDESFSSLSAFPTEETLRSFDTDGSNKIHYKHEKEMKLRKGNSSFDNNTYKKKVVTKQNNDKVSNANSKEDILNDNHNNIKNKENIQKSIQELLKSRGYNYNINYNNGKNNFDDSIFKNEDYSNEDNSEKNINYNIKEVPSPENNVHVIEIEINNSNKNEVLKNQKSNKRYTKINGCSRKGLENNDPLSFLRNLENENIKINKNFKRNIPRSEDFRIKVVKPLIPPDRKSAKDSAVNIVIKCHDKNYKFKCKRGNSKSSLYDNYPYNNNFRYGENNDNLHDIFERDRLNYYEEEESYVENDDEEDDNDDLKIHFIEERLKNYGNLENVMSHLSEVVNNDLSDSKARKIEIKFGKDKNNEYNEIKSVKILTDKDLKPSKDIRSYKGIDNYELKAENKVVKLPSETRNPMNLDTIKINNIYDIPELKNNMEVKENILRVLDMLGITEIIGDDEITKDDENSDEVVEEVNLNSDNLNEIFTKNNVLNLLNDDKTDFNPTKRQTTVNENNAETEPENFRNLPPEIIRLLTDSYFNGTENIDYEKKPESSDGNEKDYEKVNTIQLLTGSIPSNYFEPPKPPFTTNDAPNSLLNYDIFSNNDDVTRKIINNHISRLDQIGETIDYSPENFGQLLPMTENKFPSFPDNGKINSDEFEMIRKYIYDTHRYFNETGTETDYPKEVKGDINDNTKRSPQDTTSYNELNVASNIMDSRTFLPSFGINGIANEKNHDIDFDVTSIIRDIIKMDELKSRNKRYHDDHIQTDLLNFDDIMQIKNVNVPVNKKQEQLEKLQSNTKYNKCIIESTSTYPALSKSNLAGEKSSFLRGGLFTNSQSSDSALPDRVLKRSILF